MFIPINLRVTDVNNPCIRSKQQLNIFVQNLWDVGITIVQNKSDTEIFIFVFVKLATCKGCDNLGFPFLISPTIPNTTHNPMINPVYTFIGQLKIELTTMEAKYCLITH